MISIILLVKSQIRQINGPINLVLIRKRSFSKITYLSFQARILISIIGCMPCTRLSRPSTNVSRWSVRDRKRRPIAFPDRSGDARGMDTDGDDTSVDTRCRHRKGCPRSALASHLTGWSTRGSNPTITTGRDTVLQGTADLRIFTVTQSDISTKEVTVLADLMHFIVDE